MAQGDLTTSALLLSNLRLLNIVSPDIASLTLQIISAESTLHSLLQALSPAEGSKVFANCWPIYDPLQAKEFRIVAYKWLCELKSKGYLGGTIVRKSLLDDRQGERYELLLLSLSSHILRQTLPNRYPSSTRLALSPPPTKPYDIDLLRTHNLLHTYTLSHLARQRQKARVQACSFSRLLHEKATDLAAREKRSTHTLDFKTVVSSCDAELARWERHWTNIRNDWVLESLKKALSPVPPTEFFSLSYEKAFARNTALEEKKPIQTTIASATAQSESNIANLIAAEHSLKDEITALEASNSIASTPSRASTPDLRRTSLRGRKSLPPTPVKTPSPNRGAQLQFKRSTSRLSVQEMDFIAGERKTMNDEHRKVANLNVV